MLVYPSDRGCSGVKKNNNHVHGRLQLHNSIWTYNPTADPGHSLHLFLCALQRILHSLCSFFYCIKNHCIFFYLSIILSKFQVVRSSSNAFTFFEKVSDCFSTIASHVCPTSLTFLFYFPIEVTISLIILATFKKDKVYKHLLYPQYFLLCHSLVCYPEPTQPRS